MNRSTSKWQIPGFLGLAKLAAGLSVFVLLLSALSSAQSTGTVTGTVTDQSGAVVSKAKVTLVNEDTKDNRETLSNDSGYFAFPAIVPGTYTLKVSAANFKSLERKDVIVRPGDIRDVRDLALQIGTSSDVIEVTGVADEISPSDSGEHSITLTAKTIANLSLEGRDATELIKTLPGFAVFNGTGTPTNTSQDFGIVSPTGGAVGEGYVGNGAAYRGGTDLTSDGAHILDNGCNCGATATVNGDMVSEVKVQTSNFGADSAKGPIVVNVNGKSGTQTYHGEVWMHARDGSLNAVDWHTANLGQPGPPGRFLYPGGSVSGPVPHTNKKVVFYAGFEYYYQNQFPYPAGGVLTDILPTVSMRAGDFSTFGNVGNGDNAALCAAGQNANNTLCQYLGAGLTYVPVLGGPVVNGYTTPLPVDPGAAAILSQVPLPNANPALTGGYNYVQVENVNQNAFTLHPRVDYNLSENTKLYVTYNMQRETDASPIHLWWTPPNSIPFPGGMSSKDNSETISGHMVKIINPTLTNDLSAALGYINYPLMRNQKTAWDATANNYPYKTLFGNPSSGTYTNTNSNMMPDISNGYWVTTGIPFMDQPDIFENGGSFAWKKYNISGEDTITKVYKTHSIKVGGYLEKSTNDQGAFTAINGEQSYQPYLGGANCATNPLLPSGGSNPALNCGSNNQVANLIMGVGSFSQVNRSALDSLWYPTVSGYIQDDWKATRRLTLNLGLRADHLGAWVPFTDNGVASWTGNFAGVGPNPNLPGISWHGFDPIIPLSGRNFNSITWQPRFGLAYDLRGTGKTILRGGWGSYGYRDQWNDYATPADLAQGIVTFNSPSPVTLAQMDGTFGAAAGGVASSATAVELNDKYQPLSRNWNFTVSQQLPFSSLFELAYIGSDTIHEVVRPGAGGAGNPGNVNTVAPGAWFTTEACAAPCNINAGSAAATSAYTYGNTPYGANPIDLIRHNAKADYNGLQAVFARQKGRFTFNANYTWSKALGTQGQGGGAGSGVAPDSYNQANDYGVLSTDRSHIINTSYVIQEGNPFRGALGYAANGWNLSGITVWQSGQDLTEISSSNLGLSVTNNVLENAPNGGAQSLQGVNSNNWLGSPSATLQPVVLCNPTAGLKAHEYFNPLCFGLAQPGTQGQFQLPYIHGPAFFNSDLAVFKTFKINERQNVEFRFSGFNFLNHPLESFQNNGDIAIKLQNTGGTPGGAPYTFLNVSQNPLGGGVASPYVLNGRNVVPGYASTKYGRRVLEMSAKWSF